MSLKVFRFTQGWLDYYAAYEDLDEAYARRAEVDHTFHYTDVRIEEIKIHGYAITVEPLNKQYPDAAAEELPFSDIELDVDDIKEVLANEGDKPRNKGGRPKKEVKLDAIEVGQE